MRDWQKVLANEGSGEAVAAVSQAETPSIPPQIVSAGFVFAVVFVLLSVLRPPFVESADKERPLQPRRVNWPLILAASASAAGVVLLSSI